jgi:hypothetical protein
MKRVALGALLTSLVAGSVAMAGTVLPPAYYEKYGGRNDGNSQQHRPDNRHDDRGRDNRGHDQPRRDDHRNDRGNDHRNDHGNDRRNDNNWNHRDDHRNDRRDDHRWNDGRRDDHNWNGRRFDDHRRYDPPRWNGPSRPDRLPRAYYAPTYVVGDYYECGLRHPPYGYHWVRVDHDVLLTAIATGIVLDVVYNQFW